MGRRGRRRARDGQQHLPAELPEPKVPLDEWSVEEPFDSSIYLKRRAVPTYEEAGPEQDDAGATTEPGG